MRGSKGWRHLFSRFAMAFDAGILVHLGSLGRCQIFSNSDQRPFMTFLSGFLEVLVFVLVPQCGPCRSCWRDWPNHKPRLDSIFSKKILRSWGRDCCFWWQKSTFEWTRIKDVAHFEHKFLWCVVIVCDIKVFYLVYGDFCEKIFITPLADVAISANAC